MSRDVTEHSVDTKAKSLSRPVVFIALALGALLLGYADLIRGGLSISAAMLSVGYIVLVPIAIMSVPAKARFAYRTVPKKR